MTAVSQTKRHDTDAALMQVPAGYLTPPRRLGLVAKMSLTLLLILGFALGLSALLNYFNFEKGYAQLLRSRHAIVLEDMAHRIEYGLGLGLGLSSMDNVPLLLREARREQPDLTRLQVFDDRGRVIVDAEGAQGAEASAATTVPDSWREMAQVAEGRWSTESETEYLLGRTLFNSYGQREGALVLGFDREAVAGPVRELGWSLLRQAAVTLALFGLLGWLLVRLASRRLLHTLGGMRRSVETDLAGGEPRDGAAKASVDPLERDCAAFRESLRHGLSHDPRRGGGES